MNREYHRWHSPALGREMELLVFGQGGARMLAFPTSMGRFYDWEDRGMVGALAAHARGATELGDGNPRAALGPLRRAVEAWRDLGAPYEAARSRVLVALGCLELLLGSKTFGI